MLTRFAPFVQLCVVPSVKQNSRGKANGSASGKKTGSKSPKTPPPLAPTSPDEDGAALCQGWTRSAAWEDLCICVTCGFIGCLSANHFTQHFQCCPCKQEISDGKAKLEDARRECTDAFDDIAAKQQRKIKNRVMIATPTALANGHEATDGGDANGANDPVAKTGSADSSMNGELSQTESTAPENDFASSEQSRKSKRGKERKESKKASLAKSADESRDRSKSAPAPSVSSVLGFTNLGNTCYFNAAMQALLTAAHYFPEHVHFDDVLESSNIPILMTFCMLHETIKKKARRKSMSAVPDAESSVDTKQKAKKRDGSSKSSDTVLTVAPLLKEMRKKFSQFRGNDQQDAHELFTSFLWGIDEETDPPLPAEPAAPSVKENSGSTDQGKEAKYSGGEETKQIFVKTETGETISMHVPMSATVKEVQHLLAKKLNLDEDDMMLNAGPRQSTRQSSKEPVKAYSKLNFTRSLFGGILTTVVTCLACGNESRIEEDAFHLSVPVLSTTSKHSPTTIDCLNSFMSETKLLVDAKNGYDCEKCSRTKSSETKADDIVLRDAKMKLVVTQLPRVLVIHIKRLGRQKKITQHIQLDSFMEMAPYIDKRNLAGGKTSTCYELIAVVVHMGNKRSGHYVACVSRSRKRDAAPIKENHAQELDSDDEFDPRAEIHTTSIRNAASAPGLDEQQSALSAAAAATLVAEGEGRAAAANAAAESSRQALLEKKCRTVGDAEVVCVDFFDGCIEDMFMEMQVLEENQRGFKLVARFTTQQLFDSYPMGGVEANASLDKFFDRSQAGAAGSKQQILKPGDLAGHAEEDMETDFRAARFSTQHHHARGHHSNTKRGGEWTIPGSELGEFLAHFITVSNITVLPSAVQYVVGTNRATLEKKQKNSVKLTLQQVQLCVQKALLAAEEELEREEQRPNVAVHPAEATDQAGRVFQTEVPPYTEGDALTNGYPEGDDGRDEIPHACYLEENSPAATPIDRNAPISIASKPAAATTQALARKVLMTMKPNSLGENIKWTALRTKVLMQNRNQETELSIATELDVIIPSPVRNNTSSSLSTPHAPPPSSPKKTLFASLVAGKGVNDKKPITLEPDAAVLSNIFSLGTPRQLSSDELARRNDILALLEREDMKNEQRMANASIAAMSMPMSTTLADSDKSYQASINILVPPGAASLSPKRPEKQNAKRNTQNRRELSMRTKFDIERESPAFVVSEGNAHVREELNALELALCSPIKRFKGRGTKELQPSKAPSPAGVADTRNGGQSQVMTDNVHHDPHRPTQTAPSHLPQIETSRLAVGVRAVVRGVEKRGPKRSPSRKSRLKLHNYNSDLDGTEEGGEVRDESVSSNSTKMLMPHPSSPIKTTEAVHLPRIPPVSPITASPHRKHVRFAGGKTSTAAVSSAPESDQAAPPVANPARKPSPVKQRVWDSSTSSPPRVRNRHFSSGTTKPYRNIPLKLCYEAEDEDGDEQHGSSLLKC
ncbi:Ubiquitin-specific protease, partial [Globisporangium splendens]